MDKGSNETLENKANSNAIVTGEQDNVKPNKGDSKSGLENVKGQLLNKTRARSETGDVIRTQLGRALMPRLKMKARDPSLTQVESNMTHK